MSRQVKWRDMPQTKALLTWLKASQKIRVVATREYQEGRNEAFKSVAEIISDEELLLTLFTMYRAGRKVGRPRKAGGR